MGLAFLGLAALLALVLLEDQAASTAQAGAPIGFDAAALARARPFATTVVGRVLPVETPVPTAAGKPAPRWIEFIGAPDMVRYGALSCARLPGRRGVPAHRHRGGPARRLQGRLRVVPPSAARDPQALLPVLAFGFDTEAAAAVRAAAEALKVEGENRLDVVSVPTVSHRGRHWHPSGKDHDRMAEILGNLLKVRFGPREDR